MKTLNKQLWGRALDRAVPETYTTLSSEQLSRVIDEYTELVVKECAAIGEQHNRNYYKSHGQIVANKIKEHFGIK